MRKAAQARRARRAAREERAKRLRGRSSAADVRAGAEGRCTCAPAREARRCSERTGEAAAREKQRRRRARGARKDGARARRRGEARRRSGRAGEAAAREKQRRQRARGARAKSFKNAGPEGRVDGRPSGPAFAEAGLVLRAAATGESPAGGVAGKGSAASTRRATSPCGVRDVPHAATRVPARRTRRGACAFRCRRTAPAVVRGSGPCGFQGSGGCPRACRKRRCARRRRRLQGPCRRCSRRCG